MVKKSVPPKWIESSEWIKDFEKQILSRKHILLYGNVYDDVLYNEAYRPLEFCINERLQILGFEVNLRYNQIEGMTFSDDQPGRAAHAVIDHDRGQRQAFEQARRRPQDQAAAQNSEPAPSSTSDPTSPPRRTAPTEATASDSQLNQDMFFGNLRVALSCPTLAASAVIELGDMLTTSPSNYNVDERNAIALLKKCTLESAIIAEGKAKGLRNTVIIIASDLHRVPEWLYNGNPHMTLLHIPPPSLDERKAFAFRALTDEDEADRFFGCRDLTDAEVLPMVDEIADLTDGFSSVDLNALRLMSRVRTLAVRPKEVRSLVDYYKFGNRPDPWGKLDRSKVEAAHPKLASRVLGQKPAVDAVVDMLKRSKVGVTLEGSNNQVRPRGVFFFVGPTGVGKTELAKALANLVFSDERSLVRFDMSEYTEEHAAEKLAGAPPGYVGYDEGGHLTKRIQEHPHSILLFDEIEKAHPRVLDKFLQILEDGRLTDGKGRTAFFNQSVIIFTSNIGASEFALPQGRSQPRAGIYEKALKDGMTIDYEAVRSHFTDEVRYRFTNVMQRAELYNRLIGNIVVFDLLRPEYVDGISQKFAGLLGESAQSSLGLTLYVDESIHRWIRKEMGDGENQINGGRRIKSLMGEFVEIPLNKWIFDMDQDENFFRGKTATIRFTDADEFVAELT